VRADKLTTFAIISGAVGLLFSGPTLLGSGPLGWTAETFYICSAAAALGQVVMRSRAQRKLLAELQEHEAALHPDAAQSPPTTIESATKAIVDSAERIVSRASTKAGGLQIRVQELELQLNATQALLQAAKAAMECVPDATLVAHGDDDARAVHRKEISDMKTAFVSKVSHELRTPLASIKAYVEMLIDGEASDAATQQQFYEIIQNEANRLGNLIDGTLRSAA
jgi:signal transduction histidine kinase